MCVCVYLTLRRTDAGDGSGLWDDEDTRAFYENLPDLRLLVPAVLLGTGPAAEGAAADGKEEDEADDKKAEAAPDATPGAEAAAKSADDKPATAAAAAVAPAATAKPEAAAAAAGGEGGAQEEKKAGGGDEHGGEADDKKSKEEEGGTGKGVSQFDLILGRLGACANREAADVLAVGAHSTHLFYTPNTHTPLAQTSAT